MELDSARLAAHYSRFRVGDRLLLSGHSHQAWPDVAFEGQLESIEDAAVHVDEKWDRAFAKAERVRDGYRTLLGDPHAEIALAASTHDLVVRWLSALPCRERRRLVTTDGEFHTLRRQLARLSEEGFEVAREPAEPAETLAARLADRTDRDTLAVLVSAVLFETARIVPDLGELARHCSARGVPLLVDAYHALGALPFRLSEQGLESAVVIGGGYKYLQLGEGNAFLRLPPGTDLRPVVTGWYAEFARLAAPASPGTVPFGRGADALAGATYDPTSHYRAARVFDFFAEQELAPERLRARSLRQTERLARGFDALALPAELLRRQREQPLEAFGGFLALEGPRAGEIAAALRRAGVLCDARGDRLRLGPAPYVTDEQLDRAIARLGEIARS
jgi:kynureninase